MNMNGIDNKINSFLFPFLLFHIGFYLKIMERERTREQNLKIGSNNTTKILEDCQFSPGVGYKIKRKKRKIILSFF
jgi:hypothetical protein